MRALLPSREQIPIIITLAIVMMLVAGYLYIYKPEHERDIQKWRFRTLQNIDKNINEKIRNTYSFLDTYLKSVPDNIEKQNEKIKQTPASSFKVNTIEKDTTNSFENLERTTIHGEKLILDKSENKNRFHITLEYDFVKFIKPLLTTDVFDEYIIFNNGEILYQTFHSGLINYPDTLKTNGKINKNSTARDITIGGVEYKAFEQPISYKSGTSWTIIGLLTKERYLDEQSQLPPQITLILIILFCLILVLFPIVKLYRLGTDDTLKISDGISAMVVCMLMISLGSFTFLAYYDSVRTADVKPLENIANQMESDFKKEISEKRRMMLKLNKLMKNDTDNTEIIDLLTPDDTTQLVISIRDLIKGQGINRIFWLDSEGTELKTWNAINISTLAHNNYSDRGYVRKLADHQEYKVGGSADSLYSLDQVMSWTSGTFSTAMSIPLAAGRNNARILAISFKLKSLNTAKLPAGYTFAMVDSQGKVLYHSVSGKNLNENLMQEFSSCDELTSCLVTGSSNGFTTNYFGKEYSVHIRPVRDLPYYLVVMEDLGYNRGRDLQVYTFTISMQILFSVFLILLLTGIYMMSVEKSNFRTELFDSRWISPRESSRDEYIFGILINIWILGIIILFPFETFLCRLFYLLISICILPLFANIVSSDKKSSGYTFKTIFENRINICIISVITTLNIFAIIFLDNYFITVFAFQILALSLVIFLISAIKFRNNVYKKTVSFFNKFSYDRLYSYMLFTWFLLTHGISILIFFTSSYTFEQRLNARNRQVQTGNKILISSANVSGSNAYNNLIYKDGFWISDDIKTGASSVRQYSREEASTVYLFKHFRLHNLTDGYANNGLYFTRSDDSSVFFSGIARQSESPEAYSESRIRMRKSGEYLILRSASLDYTFPDPISGGVIYWIIFFVFLLVIFTISYQLIRKIFALDIPDTEYWEKFDQEMLNNNEINNLLFMIGLPGSGKMECVKDFIEKTRKDKPPVRPHGLWTSKSSTDTDSLIYDEKDPSRNTVIKVDMLLIPDNSGHTESVAKWKTLMNEACDPKYKMVVVTHFEYDFANHESNYAKLLFLERILVEAKTSKLVILSSIHPIILLHSMNQSRQSGEVEKCMERWQVLLGHFRIVIHRISENLQAGDEEFPVLKSETRYTHFLDRLYPSLVKVAKNNPGKAIEESLSFKLQTASYHFYFHIWQSLSREEKFLMYDLAEDGLVNSADKYNLCLLIDKGAIVRQDGTLSVFNRGFRNFILTGIGGAETEAIIQKIQDNRNWNKVKIPLALICIAIIGLLLSSQHQDSTRLITTLSALAAAIPTLINFISNFGGDKTAAKPKV